MPIHLHTSWVWGTTEQVSPATLWGVGDSQTTGPSLPWNQTLSVPLAISHGAPSRGALPSLALFFSVHTTLLDLSRTRAPRTAYATPQWSDSGEPNSQCCPCLFFLLLEEAQDAPSYFCLSLVTPLTLLSPNTNTHTS